MPYLTRGPFTDNLAPPGVSAAWGNAVEQALRVQGLKGTYVKYVAGAGETADVKALCDYQCTGTNDHATINLAINAVSSGTAIGRGSNGGEVILVGRNFNLGGAIVMRSQVWLKSEYGPMATWLSRTGTYAPGANGGLIMCANDGTTGAGPPAQFCVVSDLAIDGNNASTCGVYMSPSADAGGEYDTFHRLENLYIENCGTHAIRWEQKGNGRLRGNMTTKIRVLNAGSHGVYINCPDSFYSFVDVGSSGGNAFHNVHSNNMLSNCKGWFSNGHGFAGSVGRDNTYVCCQAQDNLNDGFNMAGARQVLEACLSDSNGYGGSNLSTTLGSGFVISSNGARVSGSANDKNESSRGVRMQYGLNFVGSPKVIVDVTVGATSSGSAQGPGAVGAGSRVTVVQA